MEKTSQNLDELKASLVLIKRLLADVDALALFISGLAQLAHLHSFSNTVPFFLL